MIGIVLGAATLLIWIGLLLGNGGFWLAREHDGRGIGRAPADWPDVVAVVPARDEVDVIARSIGSLAAQDYPGHFRMVLVDDGSTDGTAAEARRAASGDRLTVVAGAPLAAGWTGKLWAVAQGITAAGSPTYLWLTDADIAHAPDTLRSLVTRAEHGGLVLVSLMAKLRCRHACRARPGAGVRVLLPDALPVRPCEPARGHRCGGGGMYAGAS